MTYLPRVADTVLRTTLAHVPAVLVEGPKAVGKTSTAMQVARTTLSMERPEAVHLLQMNDLNGLGAQEPVLIDEWQKDQLIWSRVRSAVDTDTRAGRFILTGSVPDVSLHSGAGRIATMRMRPMTLSERQVHGTTASLSAIVRGERPTVSGHCTLTAADYAKEIERGGFPGLRTLGGDRPHIGLDGYLDRVITTDFAEAGVKLRRPQALRSWLRAYAACVSTTTSFEKIRVAVERMVGAAPTKVTALSHVEVLTRIGVLDPLPAWHPGLNHLGRVGSAPKHHLADPALALRLLGRDSSRLLTDPGDGIDMIDRPLFGRLFESLAALSLRTYAQLEHAEVSHFRQHDGRHEIDFVIEADAGVVAVETKLGGDVTDGDVRHLLWMQDRLGMRMVDAVVLTTGEFAYRRPDGIAVLPLGLLGP